MTGIRARAWRGASVAEMPMHEAFFPVVTASKGLLWFSSLPKGPKSNDKTRSTYRRRLCAYKNSIVIIGKSRVVELN